MLRNLDICRKNKYELESFKINEVYDGIIECEVLDWKDNKSVAFDRNMSLSA